MVMPFSSITALIPHREGEERKEKEKRYAEEGEKEERGGPHCFFRTLSFSIPNSFRTIGRKGETLKGEKEKGKEPIFSILAFLRASSSPGGKRERKNLT